MALLLGRLMRGVGAGFAAVLDQNGGEIGGVGNVHPGRSGRHARHGKADGLGLLFEQALDVLGRNMALDGVAADLGGVAGAVLVGHAELAPRGAKVVDDVRVDREAFVREEAERALTKFERSDALQPVISAYNGAEDPRVRKVALAYVVAQPITPDTEPVMSEAPGSYSLSEPDARQLVSSSATLTLKLMSAAQPN